MPRESQEHRTGRVFQFGIGNDHVEDRLRLPRDLIPHPMASNSRRQAATMAVARGSRLGRSPGRIGGR